MARSILVAYYSHSSNTRGIAELIQRETGGTLFEIQPEVAYPTAYNTVVEQAKREIQAGFRPPLRAGLDQLQSYDTILIGTPNWWSTIAPPVATFLAGQDLAGKTVAPFCTHGGGGAGHIARDVAALCPGATVLPVLAVRGGAAPAWRPTRCLAAPDRPGARLILRFVCATPKHA